MKKNTIKIEMVENQVVSELKALELNGLTSYHGDVTLAHPSHAFIMDAVIGHSVLKSTVTGA